MVYIPSDITSSLDLKEGDDVDFIKYNEESLLMTKKGALSATEGRQQQQQPAVQQRKSLSITSEELAVLKKLDSIRYGDRTKEKLKQVLNADERKVLAAMMKKKYVEPFKKPGEQQYKYGITKSIYNAFLYGKRGGQDMVPATAAAQPIKAVTPAATAQAAAQPKVWERKLAENQGYLKMLEANGFLVVSNQAEASSVSAELEESIRRGLVIGTRAFNRKYYIALKSFVSRSAPAILKAMGDRTIRVEEISKETGLEEDGIRAVLYMLAEQGEVTETKRDIFKAVS